MKFIQSLVILLVVILNAICAFKTPLSGSRICSCLKNSPKAKYSVKELLTQQTLFASSSVITDEIAKPNKVDQSFGIDIILKSTVWNRYITALKFRPIYTKCLSSMLGFMIGDLLAQKLFFTVVPHIVFHGSIDNIVSLTNYKEPFNIYRLLRMGALGLLVHGPTGHVFYRLLEKNFPGTKPSVVTKKVFIDQVLWMPVFNTLVCIFLGVLTGDSPRMIAISIKSKIVKLIGLSWLIWPMAHYVNFKLIPTKQRLLYINTVQVLYNCLLSYFAN